MISKNLYITAAVLMMTVFLLVSCGKKENEKEEISFSEIVNEIIKSPQEIYDTEGSENFIHYVEQNGYYPVMDSSHNYATPLLLTLQSGNVNLAEFFMSKGANQNETDVNGLGCIDYALNSGDRNTIDYAIKLMGDSDLLQNGVPPLSIALQRGNIDAAKNCLKSSRPEEKDKNGLTCFDYALQSGKKEAIEYAISIMPKDYWNDYQPGKYGESRFLGIIKQCSDYFIVKDVFDKLGGLINDFMDENGKTLLMYAAQYNTDVRVTKYLIDGGADINAKTNNEWTAVMYATRYNPNPAVMEDLILRGANTKPNSVGLTLTMLASCNDNPGVLLTLLKYKNEVNAQTNKGKTALMYAYENNKSDRIKRLLIENGANESIKDELGKSALMYGWNN